MWIVTAHCGSFNFSTLHSKPHCKSAQYLSFNQERLVKLRIFLPDPSVQFRALVGLVRPLFCVKRCRCCSFVFETCRVQHNLMGILSQQQVMRLWEYLVSAVCWIRIEVIRWLCQRHLTKALRNLAVMWTSMALTMPRKSVRSPRNHVGADLVLVVAWHIQMKRSVPESMFFRLWFRSS